MPLHGNEREKKREGDGGVREGKIEKAALFDWFTLNQKY